MLVEFGSGNFSYRLERTDFKDEIEALTALFNMTVEEVKSSFLHEVYVNQNETYNHLVLLFFILDKNDTVLAFSPGVQQLLLFDTDELQSKAFHSFLTEKSKRAWNRLKSRRAPTGTGIHEEYIELSLKTKHDLTLTTNCLVSQTAGGTDLGEGTLVACVEMVKSSEERELELQKTVRSGKRGEKKDTNARPTDPKKKKPYLSAADITKIRKIHDHILDNSDGPLLPLRELAHSFGTNEYKLKQGFKQLYNQTVFGFLISERLRKASVLVQHTQISIKEVAHITGFKSAPHFSRVFKEKYGYTPRELRNHS